MCTKIKSLTFALAPILACGALIPSTPAAGQALPTEADIKIIRENASASLEKTDQILNPQPKKKKKDAAKEPDETVSPAVLLQQILSLDDVFLQTTDELRLQKNSASEALTESLKEQDARDTARAIRDGSVIVVPE